MHRIQRKNCTKMLENKFQNNKGTSSMKTGPTHPHNSTTHNSTTLHTSLHPIHSHDTLNGAKWLIMKLSKYLLITTWQGLKASSTLMTMFSDPPQLYIYIYIN